MTDEAEFMRRAIELAERGRHRVMPNPLVGCVLVRDGKIIAEGSLDNLLTSKESLTGEYLSGRSFIPTPKERRQGVNRNLRLIGCDRNNLKNLSVTFPLGRLVAVTGVSGSGKSTLVNELLHPAINHQLGLKVPFPKGLEEMRGIKSIDKVIVIDQSPIGRTPRSNPATYIGAFTPIRELYSNTALSKERGYAPGQFSFNVADGRCFACEGDGVKQIEMQFLSDVYVKCDECKGKRYNSETLSVLYKGKNVSDVLQMTVYEALNFFENVPSIQRKLQTVNDVGLGYIKLGQSSTTLSGGEAQRVKLASELSKRGTGKTLYILDEPTTGLHFADVQKLLDVLNRLVNLGNTVVVIEHNMDIIKNSDWLIDLGPEGGDEGGRIVTAGTPLDVSKSPGSYTGKYLKKLMKK